MPVPSGVTIIIGGADFTNYVIGEGARFESLINAQPGPFEIRLRDPDQELEFYTGDTLIVELDGAAAYGGYITSITRKFAFPVVDTVTRAVSAVKERIWVLRGVDYNTLFDKRVLRNPGDYYHQLPNFAKTTMDGALLREALTDAKYFDIDDTEFDVTTEVDDVVAPFDPLNVGASGEGAWMQQGSTMRAVFEDLAQFSGAVFYIAPDKTFHYKALEDVVARWGFSDNPNNAGITGASGYQNATIGPSTIDATVEGGPSTMVNDALVWGGSEWAGAGQTVFARVEDAASIAEFGRWQLAEVHIGERNYKLQDGVDARANVIVLGDPGSVGGDATRGLRYPQWVVRLTWWGHKVPTISGVPDHLRAGQLVHIDLHTFGEGGSPLELLLPLRSLEMTFPARSEEGGTADPHSWVQFRGTFSLQLSDPWSVWRFLLKQQNRADRPRPFAAVDADNPAPYGALWSIEPTPAPDGATTVFDLPDDRGYIAGTSELYINGERQRLNVDYTESNPTEGEITLTVAPSGSDELWVTCRVTGG